MTPRAGFEGLREGCRWCLCVSRCVLSRLIPDQELIELRGRWKEALLASRTHPQGDRIVPRVNLRGTSLTALGEGKGKVTMEELERFKE